MTSFFASNWHPATWISERKDLLSLFFGFAALREYAAHVRRPGFDTMTAVTACLTLAPMSKPVLVTFPLLSLLPMIGMGLLLAEQRNTGEAAALYRRALVVSPGRADAHLYLARLLEIEGEGFEAQFHYREAARLRKDAFTTR